MRSADATTLFRVLLALLTVYLILVKFNGAVIVLLIAIVMFLDALDGYFAIREESKGAVGIITYFNSLLGNAKARSMVQKYRKRASISARFGARIDVAGDRAVEYSYWVIYTILGVVPLFVIFLIIIRHSFADAFMGAKGTSSHMKTWIGKAVYSSNIARGGINVVKFLAFSYLALVWVDAYPIWIGYVLTAVLVIYIMLRGVAEIYENVA